jgi:hypothetical protein
MQDKITFYASLPPIQSAVTIGGDQATRIKLDIPACELAQILKLISFYSGKSFQVTVEPND